MIPLFDATAAAPLLLGHRGHRLARRGRSTDGENTLAAFDYALAAGCDGLEFDIHRARDGRLVIHHDPAVGGLAIAAEGLRTLRIHAPQLATLRQVLRRYRDRCWLDLEVKALNCERPLATLLRTLPPLHGYVVSSFDADILRALHRLAPDVPLCLNLKRPVAWRRWADLPLAAIALHVGLARRWYLQRIRRRGLPVLVWTVNQPRQMRALANRGVQAIISDDPGLLVETLSRAVPPAARRRRVTRA